MTTLLVTLSLIAAADRPNVVVILCDDIGAHELGVYGHPDHQTPNLDRLATEGIHFLTGYATPICHSTRFALMTGQYGHRNGVYQFPGRPGGPPRAGEGVDDITNHVTIGQVFRNAGYATAMCGKWQLSGEHPDLVREAGFGEYCMWAYRHNLPPGAEHDGLWENKRHTQTARFWHPSVVRNGAKVPTTIADYGPDMFCDFALDFARRHTDEPFFVYWPMALTHSPYWPTPADQPSDAEKPVHKKRHWRSNVEYADRVVGRLVDGLERLGVAENTLVIFVGDNGTGGDGKATVTERGCRVPFLAWGPKLVQPTGACRELVDVTDILPTCLQVCDIEPPPALDGVSFAPYLRGDLTPRRRWIYGYLGGGRVLRTKRWLLERNTTSDFGRLFDCGDSRDGTGYRDVTGSTDPEVAAAKIHLRRILADKPVPNVGLRKKAGRRSAKAADDG